MKQKLVVNFLFLITFLPNFFTNANSNFLQLSFWTPLLQTKKALSCTQCQLEMWKNPRKQIRTFLISFPSSGMKLFQRNKLNQASANIERTSSKSNKILCLTWLKPAQILCWLSFDLNESFNQIQHEFSLAEIHLRPKDKRAPSTMGKFVKNNQTKQILQCSNHFSNYLS